MQVNLRLLEVDELAGARDEERHDHGQALRQAEAHIGDADEITRSPAATPAEAPDAQLDLRVVDAGGFDLPRQPEPLQRRPELFLSDVLGDLPVMDDAGHVRLECAGEDATDSRRLVGARRIAAKRGYVNDA
ncbi:hypothetical protein WMF30_54490 [Sorangium sp. So ce134]